MKARRARIGLSMLALALLLALPAAVEAKVRMLDSGNTTVIGKVRCASSCTIATSDRVRIAIAGKSFWARVLAPSALPREGGSAAVRLELGRAALTQLAGRSATVAIRVVVRADGAKRVRVLTAVLRRTGASAGEPGKEGPAAGPVSAPISNEPPTLARPATAVDVSDVEVSWFPRDSWVRYASSGVGANDGIAIGNGAVGTKSKASPCPDRPSSSDALLDYQVDFAPKPSWYDPVSGSAGIYGQGSVGFKWAAHTIDLTASDPEIEIAGAASRAIFRFSGSGGTAYPNQRASLLSLDTAGKPVLSNGGKTFTYSLMRGTLTADGVNVFAGFYTPPDNDEFGCVSVEFTTP